MRPVTLFKVLSPLLCISLAGAVGNALGQTAPVDTSGPHEYPTLQGRFADEPIQEPLVALEAFAGESEFYISYRDGDGIVYAGGNWASRIDLKAVADADGTYSGPHILPIEYQQRERWAALPESRIIPRLLSIEQWRQFRNKLLASILPTTAKSGVVVYFDNDDYFLYYTEPERFEARRLVDKPADYSVQESISFEEFLRRGLPQLESFLAEEGVTERRVLFSTGDTGEYSLPFLYVNLDLPIGAFLRYPSRSRSPGPEDGRTQAVQSVGHLAQSHLGGLVVRPASSAMRLLFVTTEAAAETVRPSWLVTLESQPIPELADGPGMNLEKWEHRLDRITGRPAVNGTIEYLIDGEQYFTHLIDAISSARESVLIRSYIFDNDDFAEKIGQLLRRRSNEGVDVKILLDGLGTIIATGAKDESMPEDYVPIQSVRLFLEEGSDIDVRQVRNPWLTGDHVKTTIIDGKIAFVGGMNIGREYRYVWHDMMMATRGPIVSVLTEEFYDAWAHAGPLGDFGYFFHKIKPRRTAPTNNGYPLRVLHTRPGDAELFRVQREAIRNARRYIYIENAYFSDDTMLYELARARRRGVDVRVILPLVSNHGALNQSNVLAANAMLEHGIRVFLYPGMSHVKAAVFDGWVCLGSANWDKLSFRTNKELNLATSHPEAVEELLERIFTEDFGKSVELTEPFPERWSDRLMEIVADYLL
jgi:cardiolipin synthase